MSTEMVASCLSELNVTLKGLREQLRELNKHLDDLDRATTETQQELWKDGIERTRAARELFAEGKNKPEGPSVRFPDLAERLASHAAKFHIVPVDPRHLTEEERDRMRRHAEAHGREDWGEAA